LEARSLDVGSRIKELRNSVGISQEDLAAEIKVSRGNVGDWERGKVKPGADALISLSMFFEVSIDWLLTGKEYSANSSTRKYVYENSPLDLTADDVEIISKIKSLSEKDRGKVEGYIDAMVGGTTGANSGTMSSNSTRGGREEAATKQDAV
jgi:transcriptional regulator with XRE-family HTH domain